MQSITVQDEAEIFQIGEPFQNAQKLIDDWCWHIARKKRIDGEQKQIFKH